MITRDTILDDISHRPVGLTRHPVKLSTWPSQRCDMLRQGDLNLSGLPLTAGRTYIHRCFLRWASLSRLLQSCVRENHCWSCCHRAQVQQPRFVEKPLSSWFTVLLFLPAFVDVRLLQHPVLVSLSFDLPSYVPCSEKTAGNTTAVLQPYKIAPGKLESCSIKIYLAPNQLLAPCCGHMHTCRSSLEEGGSSGTRQASRQGRGQPTTTEPSRLR